MSSPPPIASAQADGPIETVTSEGSVSIDTLKAVLKISKIPSEILRFNNHKLASACIKLIRERSEHLPILDDEFSVLCLQIILTGVQVSTLLVRKAIYPIIEGAVDQPDADFTIAKHAVAYVSSQIASPYTGPGPHVNPLIDMRESITLAHLLNRERERFLINCCTHPELWGGWSFAFYPAWLYFTTKHLDDQKMRGIFISAVGDLAY
ncbi:hypothetical protein FRC07_000354 [Ceratobasidium sp. 392]|nr:hypothetical protein FRC07_000354 [Ceratobasidium sp. 392]